MEQLLNNLRQLGAQKLMLIGLALAVTLGALLYVGFGMRAANYVPLYSGLEPEAAGEVVQRLTEMDVAHEVRGATILVDAASRDRLRMTLAQDGLPRQGQIGYELLDNLSGFGTTADMFNAAYLRAKEGELARTINSLQNVASSRVHVVPGQRTSFVRDGEEPSASVTVSTRNGARLSQRQAQAIRHLVALAVAGLPPHRVTVIDSIAGIVLAPDQDGSDGFGNDNQAERENRLRQEIEQMLVPLIGPGKVRVSVALELDNEIENVTERAFDPESRVAISSDTTAIEEQSTEQETDGAVGAAENVPNAEAQGAADQSQSSRTEEREVINYEVSETVRERRKLAGTIERVSVAVVVDGVIEPDAEGTATWRPRGDEELQRIANLVRSAVGYSEARGDQVTIESLPFQTGAGTGADEIPTDWLALAMRYGFPLVQLLVVAALVLLTLRFVRNSVMPQPALAGAGAGDTASALALLDGSAPAGEALPRSAHSDQAALAGPEHAGQTAEGGEQEGLAEAGEDVLKALNESLDRDPDGALQLLQSWLTEAGKA